MKSGIAVELNRVRDDLPEENTQRINDSIYDKFRRIPSSGSPIKVYFDKEPEHYDPYDENIIIACGLRIPNLEENLEKEFLKNVVTSVCLEGIREYIHKRKHNINCAYRFKRIPSGEEPKYVSFEPDSHSDIMSKIDFWDENVILACNLEIPDPKKETIDELYTMVCVKIKCLDIIRMYVYRHLCRNRKMSRETICSR